MNTSYFHFLLFKVTGLLHYNSSLLVLPHQLKRIPPHCLEGLRGIYSQLEVFTCSKSLSSLEVLPAGSMSRFHEKTKKLSDLYDVHF